PTASGAEAVEEIFAEVSRNKLLAARKTLGWLTTGGDARPLIAAAQRLIFLKGTDSHDYKFSSAVLEDCQHVSPQWRNLFLSLSVFNLKGTGQGDSPLVARTKAALAG
ncbi:MAG TPA: hypothetical protein VM165_16725, partial [Planctomycetaceae bacterium]|nr:hypothetical protein [Planctomycetaceae bacterium]